MFGHKVKEPTETITITISDVLTLLSIAGMFNPDKINDLQVRAMVRLANDMKTSAKAGKKLDLVVVEDLYR